MFFELGFEVFCCYLLLSHLFFKEDELFPRMEVIRKKHAMRKLLNILFRHHTPIYPFLESAQKTTCIVEDFAIMFHPIPPSCHHGTTYKRSVTFGKMRYSTLAGSGCM